ncbi:hypothetical protein DKM44_07950 [Deinococcus irradiatisoli]|uniref:Uncharacterized protein n=1 Tax=Deinococcus irradiatisoli TaxID=2202254 RepID=A0A2Z3JDX9_9DEIO|nr:hypothetical protein [Deinococcus irradiatisoli]AWN23165.1 hypothetical protein DKM44_07950 [Deinococcus irradiatisoli]
MDEQYKGYRIHIERPSLPQFSSGPLRGGAAQTWKVTVDGRDVARHVVRRKMDDFGEVLEAARKYVNRLPARASSEEAQE